MRETKYRGYRLIERGGVWSVMSSIGCAIVSNHPSETTARDTVDWLIDGTLPPGLAAYADFARTAFRDGFYANWRR